MERTLLHDDRCFDPDPKRRSLARELFGEVRDLPILSPHGHVAPGLFADNKPFPNPAALLIIPDHYLFRMLYSRGVPMEHLGIMRRDGAPVETDPRRIWQTVANHWYLFAGTPTDYWFTHELATVFGIEERLNAESAQHIYDVIEAALATPAFLPRALFERFGIEVLTTTDAAADSLAQHHAIRASGWGGRVVPCFRPDAVVDITAPGWADRIEALGIAAGMTITRYPAYIAALEQRRGAFIALGATSTDHGVFDPWTEALDPAEASRIFDRALRGIADAADARRFSGHMLMEFARMSTEDGLVMQIHPGSYRNHNRQVFELFGPDMGCDIPVATEFTRNLHALLNAYGNDPRLTLVLFTMDESTYSRELAPLAGHYPALRLGASWWFHDSIEGMLRYRQRVTETAGFYNTVGFTDDTRAFPSIPARHDLARRMDAVFLADLVARHRLGLAEAHRVIRALAYDLPKETYRL